MLRSLAAALPEFANGSAARHLATKLDEQSAMIARAKSGIRDTAEATFVFIVERPCNGCMAFPIIRTGVRFARTDYQKSSQAQICY
ncbi:MAG TPA: hypothetical protein GYA07_00725 [Verrucomicrobia bacterium]|nr:hypothetical protein [Verrucomicrobiota bacterium]HPU55980.1 hypothetical protein [Verrucomicrobiota bacterium]